MKVGFILSGETPYSPGVKPFLPLGHALIGLGHEASLVLKTDQSRVVEAACRAVGPGSAVICRSRDDVLSAVAKLGLEYVVSDDQIGSKNELIWIGKHCTVKTVLYNHVLFGLHSLRQYHLPPELPRRARFMFQISQTLPFSLVAARHRSLLRQADFLIANSDFTRMLVSTLYGRDCNEVIYPPFSVELFRLLKERVDSRSQRRSALLFAGGELDELGNETITHWCYLASQFSNVDILGTTESSRRWSRVLDAQGVPNTVHSLVPDEEVARLFEANSMTLLPQRWETFGNVGAESTAFGRPVAMAINQPWTEIVGPSPFIRVLGSKRIRDVRLMPDAGPEPSEYGVVRSRVLSALDPRSAAERLVSVLDT